MRRLLVALAAVAVVPVIAAGQQPSAPSGPVTLLQAIELGREQAVSAAIARLNERAAQARTAERRADLLPDISGNASVTRQTVNAIEQAKYAPSLEVAFRIAEAFSVPLEQVFHYERTSRA